MKSTSFLSFVVTFVIGLISILIYPYYTINPGVLIEEHQQLKNDCLSCHSPGDGAQTEKCMGCHKLTDIGLVMVNGKEFTEVNKKSSLLHQSIINIQCFDCHTEHNGLSRENATLNFRHDVLSTELQKECINCHSLQKPGDEIHVMLTAECSGCHNNNAWKPSHFKHELLGERKNECKSCHENKKPDDALHKGLGITIQCVQCHTTDKWKPSTFDHAEYFRFDNNHPSNCSDCHDINITFEKYTCYNCHEHTPARIEREHLKEGIRNFSNCVECHRSADKDEVKKREGNRRGRGRDND